VLATSGQLASATLEAGSPGASGSSARRTDQQAKQTAPLEKRFDRHGFGHIGMIGDIILELKGFGVDTGALESSAETTIRVWERMHDPDRKEVTFSDFDTSGIDTAGAGGASAGR